MSEIPSHIKKDVQKLAYDRTIESINRICDVYGRDVKILASAASASMQAAFLMYYCSFRIHQGDILPKTLFKAWGEAMEKEFDLMSKGFDTATHYSQMRPEDK